ncbi:MAG: polymerase, sigma-24 subunit, subfamily [Nocardioides sp.]|nr:polymerase, sigma-24 subunit, subfamily [Nocardioides sp.]
MHGCGGDGLAGGPADSGAPDARELSFDAWVEVRVPALLRFAYLVTGSQHAAEDAVQTALTRACERWPRVRRTTNPDAYVRRMVVNAHVSGWRRAGRRELSVADVRDTATPADTAEGLATADAVWRVCAGLPRQQRAAVVLRFYEDLDDAEIATILGCAQVTVRSHVHRALAALRAELDRQEQTDD